MAIKGDFISFTYNGVHSTELGVMRVTSSNRYTDALLPTIQDKTVLASGSDGTYFFGSYYTLRPITITVAFDEVSESLIRLMRKTFGDGLSHELIFDDEPYKIYYAKATGTPLLQYIPFSTPRVYKGEGTFTFTCYEPFAHCKNSLKYLNEFPDVTTDVEMNENMVSFNNGVGNLKKVEVEIEPILNLNGYSLPWAAGAGVNKAYWPTLSKTSHNGIDYTVTDDGNTLKFYGTATSASSGSYSNPTYNDLPIGPLPAGKYTVIATGFVGQNTNDRITINAKYPDGSSVSVIGGNTRISGQTGEVPDGSGKAVSFVATQEFKFSYYIYIASGTTIDCSAKIQLVEGETVGEWTPYANICPITGWTGANIYVSPTQNQADATTYTSDWTDVAGMVYSGSYDVVSGKLKARPQYVSYNGETLVEPWISSMDVYAEGATPTIGALVVDLGGVGTEYMLTPQEISTLVGLNYIWSNLGTNIDVVYKKVIGTTEYFKLEWNPSALLLESKGTYDTYNSSTGFKLYNPGDVETDFKFIIPITNLLRGIKINDGVNDLASYTLLINAPTAKTGDSYLCFNSKLNLIEGLNSNKLRTGTVYNEYINSGSWFKIPLNRAGTNWYFKPVFSSTYSGTTPILEYDYLYF